MIRAAFQRFYWPLARAVFREERVRVGELELGVLDLRPRPREPRQLRHIVQEALGRLSIAKGGFGELVTSHLKTVVASGVSEDAVLYDARVYVCNFRGPELTNPQYLACLLVWASTSIRLSRDASARGKPPNDQEIAKAAREAQLRFVHQFAQAEAWVQFILGQGGEAPS